MIELQGVCRSFGEFVAVNNVSFRIGGGEIVGLLGHNGAGKTTVMKMLTGFMEPSAGRIQVAGLDVARDQARVQARIGYLPENCPLYPEMTVLEYLDYRAGLHGVPPHRRTDALARAIALTALTPKARQTIATLSRGYRQRVGVAQAILHQPEIIILDEPTNGLDPTQIQQMRALIRDLAQTSTVMLSTHILQEVQAVCERVIILRGGEVALDSRLDDLQRAVRLRVTLAAPQATAMPVLQGVPGVASVSPASADGELFHYWMRGEAALAPRVSAAVQAAGLALHGLCPERRDLETVFAEVSEPGLEVRHAA